MSLNMELQGDNISVRQAKARLLDWSAQADEATHREVQELIATAKHSAVKAVPWAAGAALILGLLMSRRKGGGEQRPKGAIHRGIGMLRTAIKVGMVVLPLVRPFIAKKREDHPGTRG